VESAETVLYRTRPYASTGAVLAGLIGVGLLFSSSTLIYGVILLGLAIWSYMLAFVEITPRVVRVKLGMFSSTTELQLVKVETVQVGWGFGAARTVRLVGTGGTVYSLGTLPRAKEFRDALQGIMEKAHSPAPR
jgi:hypothetical protein